MSTQVVVDLIVVGIELLSHRDVRQTVYSYCTTLCDSYDHWPKPAIFNSHRRYQYIKNNFLYMLHRDCVCFIIRRTVTLSGMRVRSLKYDHRILRWFFVSLKNFKILKSWKRRFFSKKKKSSKCQLCPVQPSTDQANCLWKKTTTFSSSSYSIPRKYEAYITNISNHIAGRTLRSSNILDYTRWNSFS